MSTETQKVDVLAVSVGDPRTFDASRAASEYPELGNDLRIALINACDALRKAELNASKARGDRRRIYKRAREGLELQLKAIARVGGAE